MGIDMCRELLERGAPGLHMYTLNLEKSAVAILEGLGVIDRNNIPRCKICCPLPATTANVNWLCVQ